MPRQDPAARASARAARAGEACDMLRRGAASQNLDAAEVSESADFQDHDCIKDSRGSVPDLEISTHLGLMPIL